ncbi:MAG: alpha/beta family hydrolase [Candidatus Limnocylindria bacterium]
MHRQRILLGPGASGTIERLRGHERGLTARGMSVTLVELPRGRAERALPVYRRAVEDVDPPPIIGGHSFGGRVASLLATELAPAALVLLSYPLHAPGRQPAWEERTAHWSRITCPVLLLSGESDPFAEITLLRRAVDQLKYAELATYPGVGHGLGPVLDDALDRVAAFARERT